MRLFVLPVSGGSFPIQIALMSEVCALGVRPDLVLGSSGGNISAYLGLAADWSPYGMERIATMLRSDLFAKPWWPWPLNGIPSMIIGYFKGSVYQSGEGSVNLFQSIFTPQTIKETEIWTGTLNRTTNKPQFFCNRGESESKLANTNFDQRLLNCMPLTYLDGNLEQIAKVCLASASIPILVPEQIIDGCCHTDGGTAFASPLTALLDQVLEVQHQFSSDQPLHVDYFSSFDMEAAGTAPDITNDSAPFHGRYRNLFEHGSLTAGELVRSLCLLDRKSALSLLRGYGQVRCIEVDRLDQKRLHELELERTKYRRSVLELFPDTGEPDKVNLTQFESTDIIRLIQTTRKHYRARLWLADQSNKRGKLDYEQPWFLT